MYHKPYTFSYKVATIIKIIFWLQIIPWPIKTNCLFIQSTSTVPNAVQFCSLTKLQQTSRSFLGFGHWQTNKNKTTDWKPIELPLIDKPCIWINLPPSIHHPCTKTQSQNKKICYLSILIFVSLSPPCKLASKLLWFLFVNCYKN